MSTATPPEILYIDAFEAESEWADPLAYRVHPVLAKASGPRRELAGVLNLMCRAGDRFSLAAVASPQAIDHWESAGLKGRAAVAVAESEGATVSADICVRAFAATKLAADRATALCARLDSPPLAIVRDVNAKQWSQRLREAMGFAMGALVSGPNELAAVAAALDNGQGIVVKEDHGVSGRGNAVIDTRRSYERLRRLVEVQQAQGARGPLIVEPLLDIAVDFSGHIDVAVNGSITFLGLRRTINDQGRYVASTALAAPLADEVLATGYAAVMADVGHALFAAGYHGPASIDSALLSDGLIVPILEINARMSMGSIALHDECNRAREGDPSALVKLAIDPTNDAPKRIMSAVTAIGPSRVAVLNPDAISISGKSFAMLAIRFNLEAGLSATIQALSDALLANGLTTDLHRFADAICAPQRRFERLRL